MFHVEVPLVIFLGTLAALEVRCLWIALFLLTHRDRIIVKLFLVFSFFLQHFD